LINTRDDQQLWAEAYKRTVDDIFGVEGEVAETVAAALNAKLSAAEQQSVADKPTTNAQAFDLFLRAEHMRHDAEVSLTPASIDEAIALYERAVANDPGFALAWAMMSYSRSWLYWQSGAEWTPLQETARLALENAERALAQQPGLSEANLAMGFYHYYVRVDLAQALVSFQTALRAKPNDASVLYALGLITRRLSRFSEAIEHLSAANRLDPRNQLVSGNLMYTLALSRHYSALERFCRHDLSLDPTDTHAMNYCADAQILLHDDLAGGLTFLQSTNPDAQTGRADLLRWLKRYKEAIALIEALPDTPENFPGKDQTKSRILGLLYLESGQAAAARPLLLEARKTSEAVSAKVPDDHPAAANVRLRVAYVDALLGDGTVALELANEALTLPATLPDKNYLGWVDVAGAASRVYAHLHRADLAVPLLEKMLASPGTGYHASYAALRIDPDFEPIRGDAAFQALIKAHPGSGDVHE
jgi:tetratricopeptide (TPR) repeat protein